LSHSDSRLVKNTKKYSDGEATSLWIVIMMAKHCRHRFLVNALR